MKQQLLSVSEWKEELRAVLNGERDGLLIRFGSVSGYLESILVKNKNSKVNFNDALNEIVSAWDISKKEDKEYFIIMLELIGSYTPYYGINKIIKFLQERRESINKIKSKFGYNWESDLVIDSLTALNACFSPLPVSGEIDLVRGYIHYLEDYLYDPKYSGRVSVMLLNSYVLTLENVKIKKAIAQNNKIIYNLSSFVFSVDRENEMETNLSELCRQVFSINQESIKTLEECFALYNIGIDYEKNNPVINFPNGNSFEIDLPAQSFENFMIRKLNIHLLPQYLRAVISKKSVKENHDKIQEILTTCYKKGEEAVLLFRKSLDKIENLSWQPTLFYDLKITIYVEGKEICALICKSDYKNVWEVDEEDFIELADMKKRQAK